MMMPALWSLDLLLTNIWSIRVDVLGDTRVGLVIVGTRPKENKVSRYSFVLLCS